MLKFMDHWRIDCLLLGFGRKYNNYNIIGDELLLNFGAKFPR